MIPDMKAAVSEAADLMEITAHTGAGDRHRIQIT
jgi:hypothetical protein